MTTEEGIILLQCYLERLAAISFGGHIKAHSEHEISVIQTLQRRANQIRKWLERKGVDVEAEVLCIF